MLVSELNGNRVPHICGTPCENILNAKRINIPRIPQATALGKIPKCLSGQAFILTLNAITSPVVAKMANFIKLDVMGKPDAKDSYNSIKLIGSFVVRLNVVMV